MPAKPQEFEFADLSKRHALVVAVANIVHAAGVTVALSWETAERVVAASENFFFGDKPEEIRENTKAACSGLRDIRRVRAEIHTISPKAIVQVSEKKTQTDQPQQEPQTDPAPEKIPAGFSAFRIAISAYHETHVGAKNIIDAINIAANVLPKNISYVNVIKEPPL